MKILLVKCRTPQSRLLGVTPPVGLLYLTSCLRKELGADVRVIDAGMLADPLRHVDRTLRSFAPDVVGFSALTCEGRMMNEGAAITRRVVPGAAVVVGGPGPSADPSGTLFNPDIDVAVMGEGEHTLVELVRLIVSEGSSWSQSGNLAGIRGLAYRAEGGSVCHSEPRPPISDLDSLPEPAWDAIDLRWFWRRPAMTSAGIRPYIPVVTSRGCPYSCSFCHGLFGKGIRFRSAEAVVQEMVGLHHAFGVRDFEFLDDCMNADHNRFAAILTGVEATGMKPVLHYPNGGQKSTGKNINLDRLRENIEFMADLRIFSRGFFMLGFPSETEEEIRMTQRFAWDSPLHLAGFFIVTPFPGTPIRREFEASGKLTAVKVMDHEFLATSYNGSEVPDAFFRALVREATLRFYLDPARFYRIHRDRPYQTGYLNCLSRVTRRLVGF